MLTNMYLLLFSNSWNTLIEWLCCLFFIARTQARDPSGVMSSQSVRCKNNGEPLVHGCHCHGFGVTCLGYLDQLPYKVFVCVTPIESGVTRFNGLPFADVLEKVKLRACLPELLPRHCRFRRKLAEQNTKTQTKPRQFNFRMVRQELALMVQDHVEPFQQYAKGKSPLV